MLRLPTKGIRHHIYFTVMILNLQIIVFKQLKPTPLPQIELLLGDDIL